MATENTQLVETRRVAKQNDLPVTFMSHEAMLGLALALPVIKVDLGGPSALTVKSARELVRVVEKTVPVTKIALYEGHITVNPGRKFTHRRPTSKQSTVKRQKVKRPIPNPTRYRAASRSYAACVPSRA